MPPPYLEIRPHLPFEQWCTLTIDVGDSDSDRDREIERVRESEREKERVHGRSYEGSGKRIKLFSC